MGMEEHHRVDQAQQRLDEMDSRLDQRVGLDPREAEEITELYLARIDELQERLAALGVGSEELDTTVMDRVADFLKKVDVGNYGRLKDEFSTFLEEQMRLVEGMERVQAVPPEFDALVSSLGYGHEVAGDYYEAYQRTPESRRLDMETLNQKFNDLEDVLKRIERVSGVSPLPQASGIMAEAFSLLINGDVAGFNERMDKFNLEEEFHLSQEAISKNEKLERELADLTAKAERYDRAIEETRRDVADLQANNPYWSGREDERIGVQLKQLRDLEFKREFVGRTLEYKHRQVVENNVMIFRFQYRFGVASGAPQNETDRLLLDMSKALGDQMPTDLKDEVAFAYERVMVSGELSEFERAYYAGDSRAVSLAVEDYNRTPEDERTQEQEQQIARALETNPDLAKIREVSSAIYGKMGPVMDLLYVKGEGGELQHVTEEGAMTSEYVFELKRRVQSLSDAYNPAELRSLLTNARSSLEPLRSIEGGKEASEFETLISGVNGSLDQLETLLNEGQIDALTGMVLTDSFHKESFGEWIKKDGVVLAFAIVGGMATAGLASGWAVAGLGLTRGGYAALVVSSGFMAAGGVVGAEVGREVSDVAFDTGMESNLRRCFEGKMAVDDLLASYGKEFVVGWASSMLFMAAGKAFLQGMAKTAESSVAYASRGAQGLQDLTRSVREFAARATPPVPGGPLAQTFLQFSSEMAEELAEDAAQKIHPALGVAVQFWNSLDGRNLEASTDDSMGLGQVSQMVKGREVTSKFEYAAGNDEALLDHLRKTHPNMTVTMDENGVISARIEATFSGKTSTHALEFAPTNESIVMRQTLRRSVKPGEELSTSVLTQKYGVKLAQAPATYSYDTLSGGRIDRGLIPHLKADGYIIVSMEQDGSFVARKGEDTVAFRASERAEPFKGWSENVPSSEEVAARADVAGVDYAEQFGRIVREHALFFAQNPSVRMALINDYPDPTTRYIAVNQLDVCLRAEKMFGVGFHQKVDSLSSDQRLSFQAQVLRFVQLLESTTFSSPTLDHYRRTVLQALRASQESLSMASLNSNVEVGLAEDLSAEEVAAYRDLFDPGLSDARETFEAKALDSRLIPGNILQMKPMTEKVQGESFRLDARVDSADFGFFGKEEIYTEHVWRATDLLMNETVLIRLHGDSVFIKRPNSFKVRVLQGVSDNPAADAVLHSLDLITFNETGTISEGLKAREPLGNFEPAREFERVKDLHGSPERAAFREKMRIQQAELARLPNKVRDYCDTHPEASAFEVLRHVLGTPEESLRFSREQRLEIMARVLAYVRQRAAVAHYAREYRGREKELLAKAFGLNVTTIKGKIRMEVHGASFFFDVSDEATYVMLSGQEDFKNSEGFSTSRSFVPELAGAFTFGKNVGVSNHSYQAIASHELRHSENARLFPPNEISARDDEIHRAKDEILAYMQDGSYKKTILNTLTQQDGLYDYFKDGRRALMLRLDTLRSQGLGYQDPAYKEAADQLTKLNREWSDHCQRVQELLDIAFKVGRNNLDILTITPVNKWKYLRVEENVQGSDSFDLSTLPKAPEVHFGRALEQGILEVKELFVKPWETLSLAFKEGKIFMLEFVMKTKFFLQKLEGELGDWRSRLRLIPDVDVRLNIQSHYDELEGVAARMRAVVK